MDSEQSLLQSEKIERARRRLLRHEAAIIQEELLRKSQISFEPSIESELTKVPRPGEWIVQNPNLHHSAKSSNTKPYDPSYVKPFPKPTSKSESPVAEPNPSVQDTVDSSRILSDSLLGDNSSTSEDADHDPVEKQSPKAVKRSVEFIPFRKNKPPAQIPFKVTTNLREIVDSPLRSHLRAGMPIRSQSSLGFLPPDIDSKLVQQPARSQSVIGNPSNVSVTVSGIGSDSTIGDKLNKSSLSLHQPASIAGFQCSREDNIPQLLSPSRFRLAQDDHGMPLPTDNRRPIPMGFLPLEEFDDNEMEKFSPEEWIASAGPEGLRGFSKYFNLDGSWSWQPCRVLGYDRNDRQFLIEWDSSKKLKNVSRLNLVFKDEDKERFMKRLQSAINHRYMTESQMRYKFRLDKIPLDERLSLGQEQIQRILGRLGIQVNVDDPLTQGLLEEVIKDFRRTYHKFEFDLKLPPMESPSVITGLLVNQARPKSASPLLEDKIFSVEQSTFKERLSTIQSLHILGNPRIHDALLLINEQLLNVIDIEILPVLYMISPVDYAKSQNLRVNRIFQEIKQIVEANIVGIITACYMEDSNKHEHERYLRLLKMVNQLLQSHLRVKVLITLQDFAKRFESIAKNEELAKEPQLMTSISKVYFKLQIVLDNGKLRFDPPMPFVVEAIQSLAQLIVNLSQSLPYMVCPSIEFEFNHPQFLNICDPYEREVVLATSTLQNAMEKLAYYPQDLISDFPEYEKLLSIDVTKYTNTMKGEGKNLGHHQAEVKKFRLLTESVMENLADDISINVFAVDVLGFQKKILEASETLRKICIDSVYAMSSNQMNMIKDKLESIINRLKEAPKTPDELAALRELIKETVDDEESIQMMITSMMDKFTFLEELQFDYFSHHSIIWQIFAMPRQIKLLLADAEKVIQVEKVKMIRELRGNQKTLDSKMFELAKAVEFIQQANDINLAESIGDKARTIRSELDQAEKDFNRYTHYETLFGFERTENPVLKNTIKIFDPLHTLWVSAAEWMNKHTEWTTLAFSTMNPDSIAKYFSENMKKLRKLLRTFTTRKEASALTVALDLQQRFDDFKKYIPFVTKLRHPGMKTRHWETLSTMIGTTLTSPDLFSLEYLLNLKINERLEAVNQVADFAINEYLLESMLDKISHEMRSLSLETIPYKDTGAFIIRAVDNALGVIDDQLVVVNTIMGSPFRKPVEEATQDWFVRLTGIRNLIDDWMICQRHWLYLYPIFQTEDINRQMPTESRRFFAIDSLWKKIMTTVHMNSKVLSIIAQDKIHDQFKDCNLMFEGILRALYDYLEMKRLAFPRFYFLSNEELLELLSQAKDIRAIQVHIHKCFENIRNLNINQNLVIGGFSSFAGESISLNDRLCIKDRDVEHWMKIFERCMRSALKGQIVEAISNFSKISREKWILSWPAQIMLTAGHVIFTHQANQGIYAQGKRGLKNLVQRTSENLSTLITLIRGELNAVHRSTLSSLLIQDVHHRDILQDLTSSETFVGPDSFDWIKHMRMYVENGEVIIRMMNVTCNSGYEYLGNNSRLVVTPLTERCQRTLFLAFGFNLGGAPVGPAGTGKTETVKDLSRAVAKPCVVFNCSEGLDFKAMGRFFKGLIISGSWSCFDEFNRLDVEVLSAVGQQILTIQQALKNRVRSFVFEGNEISLNLQCAIFITMNPEMIGRNELPGSLKALFRPISMVIPDYTLICEITLYGEGFQNASILSKKIVNFFRLASEQLSRQMHYDFGMRNIKAVLSIAGSYRRSRLSKVEDVLIYRALHDSTFPKLLPQDIELLSGILRDLFPGISVEASAHRELIRSIELTIEDFGLQAEASFVNKCVQLHETTCIRHGIMLIGKAFTGKTMCYRVLAEAITRIAGTLNFKPVHVYLVNPKAVTIGHLYGQQPEQNKEWKDGIISNIIRTISTPPVVDSSWVVLDGPVDSFWIENLNSLLDDNKVLCIPNGERITLPSNSRVLFEVSDLVAASPATVSRCGMVYMDEMILQWTMLIQSWLSSLPDQFEPVLEILSRCFSTYVDEVLVFIRSHCIEPIPTNDCHLVRSFLRLLDCFISRIRVTNRRIFLRDGDVVHEHHDDQFEVDDDDDDEEKTEKADAWSSSLSSSIHAIFVFCMVWSLGATIDDNSRPKLSEVIFDLMKGLPGVSKPPEDESIYDYLWSFDEGKWCLWASKMELLPSKMEENCYGEYFVPNVDTMRVAFITQSLSRQWKPVLVFGDVGIGKSALVRHMLQNMSTAKYLPVHINLCGNTLVTHLQQSIENRLERRRKGQLGPPVGRKMIFFVDDLNMPIPERSGAQPPLELLRQYLDHGGWYDRKSITFNEIVDVQVITSMSRPGGGRNPITARLLRHFNVIYFNHPEHSMVSSTLLTYFSRITEELKPLVKVLVPQLVAATLELFEHIFTIFRPTPAKSHYLFSLRDVYRLFQAMATVSYKILDTPEEIVALWYHESERIVCDRLSTLQDINLFKEKLDMVARNQFSDLVNEDLKKSIYCHFMNPEQQYKRMGEGDNLIAHLEGALEDYNAGLDSPVPLVIFREAAQHIVRISRILRQPNGHVLMVGAGSSGRKSVARLAAFVNEMEVMVLTATKAYGEANWKEDLKKIFHMTGVEATSTVFLLDDTYFSNEIMFEDLNMILQDGDLPHIYTREDYEVMYDEFRREGIIVPKDADTAYFYQAFFLTRVRMNLRIAMTVNSASPHFRKRLRTYPALVSCCQINWFFPWSEEALYSVGLLAWKNKEWSTEDPGITERIVQTAVQIHISSQDEADLYQRETKKAIFITPSTFLHLTSTFARMFDTKGAELAALRKRLLSGLEKLQHSSVMVNKKQEEFEALVPVLEKTTVEMEELMKRINDEQQEADLTRDIVLQEERKAEAESILAREIAESAQEDLAQAMPSLEMALSALNSLSKRDIVEVKSMLNPPQGITYVVEAVCILMGRRPRKVDGPKGQKVDDYWSEAKLMMNDPHFIQKLMAYDRDNISEDTMAKLRPYLDNPAFTPSNVEKSSVAGKSLCAWVRAMEKYYVVSRVVGPKKERLKEANAALRYTLEKLEENRVLLRQVEDKIKNLQTEYDEAFHRKSSLSAKIDDCETKMERAHRLISGLASERVLWEKKVKQIEQDYRNLIGDILLSSACICYIGPFPAQNRATLLAKWKLIFETLSVSISQSYSFVGHLCNPLVVDRWYLYGLPRDLQSTQNAIVAMETINWPLLVDPQNQASAWIRRLYRGSIEVLKVGQADLVHRLEHLLKQGGNVMIEDIGEEINPPLDQLLSLNRLTASTSPKIRFNDKLINLSPSFQIFFVTKLATPTLAPEIFAQLNVLNFSISHEGLLEQLLAIVVAKERPDLENARSELLAATADMKKEIKETEDKILASLSNATGEILENEQLIMTLKTSKENSDNITTRMAEMEKTENEIEVTRKTYYGVSQRATILYFLICSLHHLDPMYHFSLRWYIQLFAITIDQTLEKSEGIVQRLELLTNRITHSIYYNVGLSLTTKHKLQYSLLLCTKILESSKRMTAQEWRYFLTAFNDAGNSDAQLIPAPSWVEPLSWAMTCGLSKLPKLDSIVSDIVNYPEVWQEWTNKPNPYDALLPAEWETSLSRFQKLLVLRCLKPEKAILGFKAMIVNVMGPQYIEPPLFDLNKSYQESAPTIPIMFILSGSEDPLDLLYQFSTKMGMGTRIQSLSMGKGQTQAAENIIAEAIDRGHWVLLQNCHLALSWMPRLQTIIEEIPTERVHHRFRIWMTTLSAPNFPAGLLQMCIKITTEPPTGIRSNMLRSFTSLYEKDEFASITTSERFQRLAFNLSFLHSVIASRRTFGTVGWSSAYDFNDSDYHTALREALRVTRELGDRIVTLEMPGTKKTQKALPYESLQYVVSNLVYGGRLTESWDDRILKTLTKELVSDDIHNIFTANIPIEATTITLVTSKEDYLKYIQSLPVLDEPEILGLHFNAQITSSRNQLKQMMDSLLSIQPRSWLDSSINFEQSVESKVTAMALRLPRPIDPIMVALRFPIDYENCLNTVVQQEVLRFNQMLLIIRDTLQEVDKAIQGKVVMSGQLEVICQNIVDGVLPQVWMGYSYPTTQGLGSWFTDFLRRFEYISDWVHDTVPEVFWFSGLFFPQGFLTAVLQDYSRRSRVAVDLLAFDVTILDEDVNITNGPVEGCYITGLYLEGASWDPINRELVEPSPLALYHEMPNMWLRPVLADSLAVDQDLMFPVYITSARSGSSSLQQQQQQSNYVFSIYLPSRISSGHWIKRGVALLCSVD
eukprot:TRINITY_DN7896_c0_g1_i2.p1 TRINITY_DN7896_c0_g1~~TRINITY_DN7896_c0_g1_i2.p1  ORF type:complete len:4263 (-),score=670.67 TRINITY_DN7896_c0_g1_i2:89-12877(-)